MNKSRYNLIVRLIKEVRDESYEEGRKAMTFPLDWPIVGSCGCPLVDFDWLARIDRMFRVRLDRLERLKKEAAA